MHPFADIPLSDRDRLQNASLGDRLLRPVPASVGELVVETFVAVASTSSDVTHGCGWDTKVLSVLLRTCLSYHKSEM